MNYINLKKENVNYEYYIFELLFVNKNRNYSQQELSELTGYSQAKDRHYDEMMNILLIKKDEKYVFLETHQD